MSFGSLRSLVLGINQAVHGLSATITPKDSAPITTTVIWTIDPSSAPQPYGTDLRRVDPRRLLTISKADVPSVARGAIVLAPEIGGGVIKTWVVDGIDRDLADQVRVFVKLQN